MTRPNPDPSGRPSMVDAFRRLLDGIVGDNGTARPHPPGDPGLLDEALKRGERTRPPGTVDPNTLGNAEDAWKRATRDAARRLCADAGKHQYKITGALTPTAVECARCGDRGRITGWGA